MSELSAVSFYLGVNIWGWLMLWCFRGICFSFFKSLCLLDNIIESLLFMYVVGTGPRLLEKSYAMSVLLQLIDFLLLRFWCFEKRNVCELWWEAVIIVSSYLKQNFVFSFIWPKQCEAILLACFNLPVQSSYTLSIILLTINPNGDYEVDCLDPHYADCSNATASTSGAFGTSMIF